MTAKASITAIVAAMALMLFGATGAGAQSSTPQANPADPAAPAEPTIPERAGVWGDIIYGNPDAPVELIEYASLTCPHCASFSRDVMPRLMVDFINDGKVRLVFRNFVLNRLDLAAAAASRCMAEVDATKRTVSALFAEQATWTQAENPIAVITEIVGREGLSQQSMAACVTDRQVQRHIVEMMQSGAKEHDVKAVPTLVLNGVPMSFPGYAALKLRIEAQLGSDYLNSE